jgi:NitT/TauT family transport system ATP-binding protein
VADHNVVAEHGSVGTVPDPAGSGPGRDPRDAPVIIEAEDLSFRHTEESPYVLQNLNLQVRQGEILVLIGPSGCGKSTILNLVAGIYKPTGGRLSCLGSPVAGLNKRVTYMTQFDTLLPWRSAIDNAAMPLEIKGVGKKERYERAREQMAKVGVGHAEKLRPHQLSGGMRSRLSLARALLTDTDIMLMDEPFSAIDALLRVRLQQLLLDVWHETGRTLIYVTHDLDEAITLGHRVAVMSTGPARISLMRTIDAPQPRDVARFRATSEARALYVELWEALERPAAA